MLRYVRDVHSKNKREIERLNVKWTIGNKLEEVVTLDNVSAGKLRSVVRKGCLMLDDRGGTPSSSLVARRVTTNTKNNIFPSHEEIHQI